MEKRPSKKTTRTRQAREKEQPAIPKEAARSEKLGRKRFADMAPDLIRAAFKGLLGREPDSNGLVTYNALLTETRDLSAVITDISHSDEFRRNCFPDMAPDLVRAAFRGLLGREPEDEALAAYAPMLAGQQDLSSVLAEIVSSEEFKDKAAAGDIRNDPAFEASDLDRQKLVFLHHPKTGGTTLHNILIAAFDKGEVCPERFNGLHCYPAGALARYRFFSGHFDLPSVKLIPGRKKIITMLREPVARLVSLYYFQRAHTPEVIERNDLELARLANKYSMADFFRAEEVRSHPTINNAMTRVLVETVGYRWESKADVALSDAAPYLRLAIQELEAFDAFGIMERYDESVRLICETVGLRAPSKVEPKQVLEVIMRNEPGLRVIEKEPVTTEIRRLIEGLVGTDAMLYLRACSVFEKRLAAVRRRDRRYVNRSPRAVSSALISEGSRL